METKNTATEFYADYDNKYSYIDGKRKSIGHYATVLLNMGIEILISARSSADTLKEQLANLFAAETGKLDFVVMKNATLQIIDVIWNYEPFSRFDMVTEKVKIESLFLKSAVVNFIGITETLQYTRPDEVSEAVAIRHEIFMHDKADFDRIGEVMLFYANAIDDITMFTFVRRAFDQTVLPNSPKRDAVTLYSRALDFYRTQKLQAVSFRSNAVNGHDSVDLFVNTETEFVTLTQKKKSGSVTVCARRVYFHSVIDFLMYDFLEGLRISHYPIVCGICKRSFLMMSAHTRRYCNGYAPPEMCNGKRLTCRQVAAKAGRAAREKAEDHPVKIIYTRRCNTINKQLERGNITPEFGKAAKSLAKEKMQCALSDNEYFRRNYAREMQQDSLYTEVKKRIN